MESDLRCSCYTHQYSKVRAFSISDFSLVGRSNNDGSLLNDPNTSSPANVEASNLFKDNKREYVKRVRETVEKSWEDN